jgi:hypothetical protein
MRWNPFFEVRCDLSPATRTKCKGCGSEIPKGHFRAQAIPILGKPEYLHLDCAAKRAPDVVRRKVVDEDPTWPEGAVEDLKRFAKDDVLPAPRSYQRTPIMDLSYQKGSYGHAPCVFCGEPCPEGSEPAKGHAIRAFSVDGERRFHPMCIAQLAPGLCRRIAVEDSERWPADLKLFFAKVIPNQILPTPRSPWRDTAGEPKLHASPSNRASCKFCTEKITKGQLRLGREQIFGMRRSPVYFHVDCYAKSDDYHPKMLEMIVLRAPAEVPREAVQELARSLPLETDEERDVGRPWGPLPTLEERLMELFDRRPNAAKADAQADAKDYQDGLTKNVVEIPEGFFQ